MTTSVDFEAGFDVVGKCFLSEKNGIRLELRAPASDIGIKEIGRRIDFQPKMVYTSRITPQNDQVVIELITPLPEDPADAPERKLARAEKRGSAWTQQDFRIRRLTDADWEALERIFPNPANKPRYLLDALRRNDNTPLEISRSAQPSDKNELHQVTVSSINNILRTANAIYKIIPEKRGGRVQIAVVAGH